MIRILTVACACLAFGPSFEVGSSVKVVARDITLYHSPKHPEGINPAGWVGTVKRIATVPRDGGLTPISANRPICVKFDQTVRIMAHFDLDELAPN